MAGFYAHSSVRTEFIVLKVVLKQSVKCIFVDNKPYE